jgi:hypothetical protein
MRVRYVSALVSILAGIVLLIVGNRPLWWFGGGAVAAGLALAAWTGRDAIRDTWSTYCEAWSEPTTVAGVEVVPLEILREVLCIGTLLTIAIVTIPDAFLGERPTDHDHTVHYFKAWQLEHEFLLDGRFWGWSQEWFAGYPAQYLYPVGGDLLVVGVHVLSLGLLTFSQAYALAIAIFWTLRGYAVYRLAATGFDRWVGVLAGVLFMTDTAANRIGGWYFAMNFGVWPMSLAVALVVLAVSRTPALLDDRRPRDIAIVALLLGAALLSHPFAIIYFGLTASVLLFAYWLVDRRGEWAVGSLRLVAAAALGGALALFWLAPFMTSSSFMDPNFGGRWASLFQMGRKLYHLNLFPGTWSLVVAFGFAGTLMLLWRRQLLPLTVGLLTLAFMVVGSTDFLAGFHVLEAFPSLQRIHFKRFITLLKPYWVVAAAFAVVQLVRTGGSACLEQWRGRSEGAAFGASGSWAIWGRVFVVGLCLTPLLVPFFAEFGSQHLSRSLTEPDERAHRRARDQLVQWVREHHSEDESFYRIAMWLSRHDHRFVDLGARLPVPLYKIGYMPATSFVYRFEAGDPKLLEAIDVRYVVSLRPRREPFLEPIEQFGRLRLYRFKRWDGEPFEVVEGSGSVEVKSFDTESIVLEAGPSSSGRLRLNVSHFDRWHATRNGEPIEIEARALEGFDFKHDETGFMTVELEPGTYRFEFRRGWIEWTGLLISLLALGLVLALVAADRRWGPLVPLGDRLDGAQSRLTEWLDAHPVVVGWLGRGALVGVLLFALGLVWYSPAVDVRDQPFGEAIETVHYDFADELREASVSVGERGRSRACRQVMDRFVCGREIWKHVHTRVEDFGPSHSMYRCIRAHPVGEGPIRLQFAGVPTGDAIVGHFGVAESGQRPGAPPVRLTVAVDGVERWSGETKRDQEVFTFRTPMPESAEEGRATVQFKVDAPDTGKRHFCFNAQVVDTSDTASGE